MVLLLPPVTSPIIFFSSRWVLGTPSFSIMRFSPIMSVVEREKKCLVKFPAEFLEWCQDNNDFIQTTYTDAFNAHVLWEMNHKTRNSFHSAQLVSRHCYQEFLPVSTSSIQKVTLAVLHILRLHKASTAAMDGHSSSTKITQLITTCRKHNLSDRKKRLLTFYLHS